MNAPISKPGELEDHSGFDELARTLKAAADPFRLEILRVLSTDSFGVLELCQLFDIRQPGMSHHLKVLATAGLVTSRREGNSMFYRRTLLEDFSGLHRQLLAEIDAIAPAADVCERIDEIHQQRAAASRAFFAEQAGEFRQKQDMIASFDVYGPQVAEMLDLTLPGAHQLALEVGPGDGEFLPQLARRFQQVVALDNSPVMLEKARAANGELANIDFINADTRYCQRQPARFDCAVINMVLHHTPAPSQVFADVGACLKPGASLLVSELCRHDQDWAREACGDYWLGFEPHDLSRWAEEQGFAEGRSVYFALRNGFQIQLRHFLKEH